MQSKLQTNKVEGNTMKYYVGHTPGKFCLFRSAIDPTEETHGHLYGAFMGPFYTKRGASFMAAHGRANPYCRCVADAEKLGRLYTIEYKIKGYKWESEPRPKLTAMGMMQLESERRIPSSGQYRRVRP